MGRGAIAEFYTSIEEVQIEAEKVLKVLAIFYQLDAA
jgi:hypothetical protein